MTAPIRQQIRCLTSGHDWRLAIDPQVGSYRRCRRCWRVTEATAEVPERRGPSVKPGLPHAH